MTDVEKAEQMAVETVFDLVVSTAAAKESGLVEMKDEPMVD
jgi:hypothetical protein